MEEFSLEEQLDKLNIEPPAKKNEVSVSQIHLDDDMDIEAVSKAPTPAFIKRIQEDRRAAIAHTFLIHGNINDYVDTTGNGGDVITLLSTCFDTAWINNKMREQAKKNGTPFTEQKSPIQQVFAYYTIAKGLVFPEPDSKKLWDELIEQIYAKKPAEIREAIKNPDPSLPAVIAALNYGFDASKTRSLQNRSAGGTASGTIRKEFLLTVAFRDADMLFPDMPVAQMQEKTLMAIGHLRQWASDRALGDKNTILLLSKSHLDIHSSIRNGDAGVGVINLKRPTLEERYAWLNNFSTLIKANRPMAGGERRDRILYDKDLNNKIFAIQSAGMNLKQMEQVIRNSWRAGTPVDFGAIATRKKEAVQDEFGGLIEFVEPTFGFEQVGGHENIKEYLKNRAIKPLQRGDTKRASMGILLPGPPGTGKTQLARATAKEARMNFILFNLGQLFGGILGESESNMRKATDAIMAAAPVVVFMDELDSQSPGRQSFGDSGVSGRQFNSLLQFLSDGSRLGKVFVMGATNRPDLLDAALRRPGRFDAIIPALPPAPGDSRGRATILAALAQKYHIKWAKDVQPTLNSAVEGLGRMLKDEAIWTGAEMEVVLKDALENCLVRYEDELYNAGGISEDERLAKLAKFSEAPSITLADLNKALEYANPNTGEVEFQINLALYYSGLKYCPAAWLEQAKDRKKLDESIQAHSIHSHLMPGSLDREI